MGWVRPAIMKSWARRDRGRCCERRLAGACQVRHHARVGADGHRLVKQSGELTQRDGRPVGRAGRAGHRQAPPAHEPAARVDKSLRRAATAARADADRPHPLPAVPQAALVSDVPPGRGDLEQHRDPVVCRAAAGLRRGQRAEAVEAAPAPALRRCVPPVPHAGRNGGDSVHPVRADGQPGEPRSRAVRGQDRMRQLEARNRAVRPLVRNRPAQHRSACGRPLQFLSGP